MNKLKGSSSAIKMKYLLTVFAVAMLVVLPTRVYQLLAIVNPHNGFYENGDMTVPVLYGVVFIFALLFMILSYLSKEVPSPKLPTGKNFILGIASIVMVVGLVTDIISIESKVIPGISADISLGMLVEPFVTNLHQNGGIFLVLQFIFAIFSCFYFLVFAVSHLNGKASYKEFKLLALSPLCWCISMLISKLMTAVSFISASELLFEIFALVFMMTFFLTFARISSGVFTEDSMWGIYGYGLTACLFIGLVTIPRLISLAVGLEPVVNHEFNFAFLAALVFIFAYIIASLGIGFKDGILNRKSVSEVELPGDEDVVIKEDETAEFFERMSEDFEDDSEDEEEASEEEAPIEEEPPKEKKSSHEDVYFTKKAPVKEDLDEVIEELKAFEEEEIEEVEEAPAAEEIEEVEEAPAVEEIEAIEEEETTEEPIAVEVAKEEIEESDEIEIPEIAEEAVEIIEEDAIEIPEISEDNVAAQEEEAPQIEEEQREEQAEPQKLDLTNIDNELKNFEDSSQSVVTNVEGKTRTKSRKQKKSINPFSHRGKEEEEPQEIASDLKPISLAEIRKKQD